MNTQTQTRNKNIFDYKMVQGVSAVALLKDGQVVGKIIANWSDNPNGSVCTAQVLLWDKELAPKVKLRRIKTEFLDCELAIPMIGKASGYGYDKLSSAISQALEVGGIRKLFPTPVEGGSGNQQTAFESAGFEWVTII